MNATRFQYRPDIDGLRAIAVLGVLLYHAGWFCPGGFVGVDVFFVISGYLITSIIQKDIEQGSFSMLSFWVRRIRRILPAVSVMAFLVLLAGFLVLDPPALVRLAKDSVAQSLMAANIHFYQGVNYFGEASRYKLLLHTWSLAVEEQFYVLFPVLLFGITVLARRWRIAWILGLWALSFALNLHWMEANRKAAFFLLPARAWELITGAVIALAQPRLAVRGRTAGALSTAGFALILGALFGFSDNTPFPGVWALLPVAGAALVIVANQAELTWVGRWLSWKPVVYIGLISYSLYLWHWPLLVFPKLILTEPNSLLNGLALAASFPLAVLSYKFVEQPFRHKQTSSRLLPVFLAGLAAVLAVLVPGLLLVQGKGFPERLDPRIQTLLDDVAFGGMGDTFRYQDKGLPIGARLPPGTAGKGFDFALVGDSHGIAVADAIHRIAAEKGLAGLCFLRGGEPPVTGLWRIRHEKGRRKDVLKRSRAIVNELLERKVRHVILVARWSSFCEYGDTEGETDPEGPHARTGGAMVVDNPDEEVTPENSARAFARQLAKMTDRLTQAGLEVWILKQVPEADRDRIAYSFYLANRFPRLNRLPSTSVSLEAHRARQARANAVLDALASDRIHILDPAPAFFPAGDRLALYGDRPYYRDSHHVSRYGADTLLGPLFDQLFERLGDHPGKE